MDWTALSNEWGGVFLFMVGCVCLIGAVWLITYLIRWLLAGAGLLGLICAEISGTALVGYIICWILALPVMLVLSILAGLTQDLFSHLRKTDHRSAC